MIRIPQHLLDAIAKAAEAAFPGECCGLLVGKKTEDGEPVVNRVVPSPNVVSGNSQTAFEISPRLRFDLMRELRNGPESIIGHYHSHPDQPAIPSKADQDRAWEPGLFWIIQEVRAGKARRAQAYHFDKKGRYFVEKMDTAAQPPQKRT